MNDTRYEVGLEYSLYLDWQNVFFTIDPNIFKLSPNSQEFAYIARKTWSILHSEVIDNEEVTLHLETLAYILLKCGAVFNLQESRKLINFFQNILLSKNAKRALVIADYALFSCEQWVGQSDIQFQDFGKHKAKITKILNDEKSLLLTPLHYHLINRSMDIEGFKSVGKSIDTLHSFLTHNLIETQMIVYGIESRQWAFQFLELQRIYHLFLHYSRLGLWSEVTKYICLISIPGYTANNIASKNFAKSLNILLIDTIPKFKELVKDRTEKKAAILNQYTLCADIHIIDSLVYNKSTNINTDNKIKTISKPSIDPYIKNKLNSNSNIHPASINWLLKYQFGFKNYPFRSMHDILRGNENSMHIECKNHNFIVLCFKDSFRKEQSGATFRNHRGGLLCPSDLVSKVVKYLLENTEHNLLIANDFVKQHDELNNYIYANSLYSRRVINYNEFHENSDIARLICLQFIDDHCSLSIGDLNGCHDVSSTLTHHSIYIGHTYNIINLPIHSLNKNSSRINSSQRYESQSLHFIPTYQPKYVLNEKVSYGNNSYFIDKFYTKRSSELIFNNFKELFGMLGYLKNYSDC